MGTCDDREATGGRPHAVHVHYMLNGRVTMDVHPRDVASVTAFCAEHGLPLAGAHHEGDSSPRRRHAHARHMRARDMHAYEHHMHEYHRDEHEHHMHEHHRDEHEHHERMVMGVSLRILQMMGITPKAWALMEDDHRDSMKGHIMEMMSSSCDP